MKPVGGHRPLAARFAALVVQACATDPNQVHTEEREVRRCVLLTVAVELPHVPLVGELLAQVLVAELALDAESLSTDGA